MSQTHSDDLVIANGSFKSYSIGFLLAIILTAISFGVVMGFAPISRALA